MRASVHEYLAAQREDKVEEAYLNNRHRGTVKMLCFTKNKETNGLEKRGGEVYMYLLYESEGTRANGLCIVNTINKLFSYPAFMH